MLREGRKGDSAWNLGTLNIGNQQKRSQQRRLRKSKQTGGENNLAEVVYWGLERVILNVAKRQDENSKYSVTMKVIGNFIESNFWDSSGGRNKTEMSRRMNWGSGVRTVDNSLEKFS